MKIKFLLLLSLIIGVSLFSCENKKEKHTVSQVDGLIRDLSKEKSFSIILHDMDMDENENYKHQYKIILHRESMPKDSITDWKPVTEKFFQINEENMGMEIASKDTTGKVSKKASPPGYNNYVGNSQYGNWKTDNSGNSFWEFYGQYMFMQHMLGLNRPVYRTDYHTYTTEYRNSDRSYYGSNKEGKKQYGTYSDNGNSKSNYRKKVDAIQRSDRSGSKTNKNYNSYSNNKKSSTSNNLRNNSNSRSKSSSIFKSGSSSRSRKR